LLFSGTSDLTYTPATGVLTVANGKNIASATASTYTLTLTATPGGKVTSAAGSATLTVNVQATCGGATQVSAVLGLLFLAVFASSSV